MNIITKEDEDLMRAAIAETLGIPVADVTAAHAGHLALHHMDPGAHCAWRRRPDDRVAGIPPLAFGVEETRPEFERRYTTQADIDRGETRIPRLWVSERLTWGGEDVRPISRRRALCIVGIAWAGAGVMLALMALGNLLQAVASR